MIHKDGFGTVYRCPVLRMQSLPSYFFKLVYSPGTVLFFKLSVQSTPFSFFNWCKWESIFRSALTFLCGIYVYGVTWILLGQSKEETLSPGVWKQFMVSEENYTYCVLVSSHTELKLRESAI